MLNIIWEKPSIRQVEAEGQLGALPRGKRLPEIMARSRARILTKTALERLRLANIPLTSQAIMQELTKDIEFKTKYDLVLESLNQDNDVALQAPLIVSTKDKSYCLFSRETLTAIVSRNLPVKAWVSS